MTTCQPFRMTWISTYNGLGLNALLCPPLHNWTTWPQWHTKPRVVKTTMMSVCKSWNKCSIPANMHTATPSRGFKLFISTWCCTGYQTVQGICTDRGAEAPQSRFFALGCQFLSIRRSFSHSCTHSIYLTVTPFILSLPVLGSAAFPWLWC